MKKRSLRSILYTFNVFWRILSCVFKGRWEGKWKRRKKFLVISRRCEITAAFLYKTSTFTLPRYRTKIRGSFFGPFIKVYLKGVSHEIFDFNFLHVAVSPRRPLSIPLGPLQMFTKILENIRNFEIIANVLDISFLLMSAIRAINYCRCCWHQW
jgi:hypothetical protein